MQSAKVVVEEEDLSFGCLWAKGFPLDYLSKKHGIEFTKMENEYIQIVYMVHLLDYQIRYESDRMPKPCIGTAMELWGLIQSTFPYETDSEGRMRFRLERFAQNYKLNDVVLKEILMQTTEREEILTILNGIFQKICRTPNFIFDDEIGNFTFYENENLMKMAQYLIPYTLEYGQFPIDNISQTYFELDNYEKYGISLMYIQLLWSFFFKHSRFVMPLPTGTAMEIFFMARISSFSSGLEGAFFNDKTSRALSQVCDVRFIERVNPPLFFEMWVVSFFDNIGPKMIMRVYKDYVRKQKQDISLMSKLSNRLPMDIVKHVEEMYKENFFQGRHIWRPFQFLRDANTGLWFLPPL
jgi:hypothetical protein